MHIIAGDRGSGKTQALVDWVMEAPARRVVITHSRTMRNDIAKRLVTVGYQGARPKVFTAQEALIGAVRGLPQDTEFAVDELQLVLDFLLHTMGRVSACTMEPPTVDYLSPPAYAAKFPPDTSWIQMNDGDGAQVEPGEND